MISCATSGFRWVSAVSERVSDAKSGLRSVSAVSNQVSGGFQIDFHPKSIKNRPKWVIDRRK